MNRLTLSSLGAVLMLITAGVQAQFTSGMPPGKVPVYMYEQRPLAGLPVLINPQQAQVIVDEFRTNYAELGSPRILIQVSHDSSTTGATNQINGRSVPAAADTNTIRNVEHLTARPLRIAGATLVDQTVARQINGGHPVSSSALMQDKPGRDALNRVADVVIEVSVSSRSVTMQESSGVKTYTVPDIQMTAIRVKDAKTIGRVSASELITRAAGPAYVARNFGVEDVAEATSLALMDDMLRQGK